MRRARVWLRWYRLWRRRRLVYKLGRAWTIAAVCKEQAGVFEAQLDRLDELLKEKDTNGTSKEG